MEIREKIKREIDNLPNDCIKELQDFIRFLELKSLSESRLTAIASEAALREEWLNPEEDEAWRGL